ncbi:hypothetical protein QBC44DRAFT_303998 [Cladorrhinum sp. PSN332]|nr:hypothetical protein QBC44DRAFT_303998 [Cladorrhinum sp. PSN332]
MKHHQHAKNGRSEDRKTHQEAADNAETKNTENQDSHNDENNDDEDLDPAILKRKAYKCRYQKHRHASYSNILSACETLFLEVIIPFLTGLGTGEDGKGAEHCSASDDFTDVFAGFFDKAKEKCFSCEKWEPCACVYLQRQQTGEKTGEPKQERTCWCWEDQQRQVRWFILNSFCNNLVRYKKFNPEKWSIISPCIISVRAKSTCWLLRACSRKGLMCDLVICFEKPASICGRNGGFEGLGGFSGENGQINSSPAPCSTAQLCWRLASPPHRKAGAHCQAPGDPKSGLLNKSPHWRSLGIQILGWPVAPKIPNPRGVINDKDPPDTPRDSGPAEVQQIVDDCVERNTFRLSISVQDVIACRRCRKRAGESVN